MILKLYVLFVMTQIDIQKKKFFFLTAPIISLFLFQFGSSLKINNVQTDGINLQLAPLPKPYPH